MVKFRDWFKTSAFYYWPVLVWWPSFKNLFASRSMAGEMMQNMFSIVGTLILSFVGVLLLNRSGIYTNLPNGASLFFQTLGATVLGYIVIRFLTNLVYIPSKTYFESRKKQDRQFWDDIYIYHEKIKDRMGVIRNHGFLVKNKRPFNLGALEIMIRFLEIDNVVHVDLRTLGFFPGNKDNCTCKLAWQGRDSKSSYGWASRNGGTAIAYFLEVYEDGKNKVRCLERSDRSGELMPTLKDVKQRVRGEFMITTVSESEVYAILEGIRSTSQVYNFETTVDYGVVKMTINEGEIKHSYKPPQQETV